MVGSRWAVVALVSAALCGSARAAEGPRVIASGDWSKPVADSRGYAVRGRLVLCEKKVAEDRRETAVYVELQDASPFIGSGMRLFCNFRPAQPDTKAGMHTELRDANRKPVPSQPFAFGGAVPVPQWVSLPTDATIRLRTSPFGVHRPKALAIAPQLSDLWIIADDDPKEYFLSATVVIDSPVKPEVGASEHVWSGAVELPAMRIRNGRSVVKSVGAAALLARQSLLHPR